MDNDEEMLTALEIKINRNTKEISSNIHPVMLNNAVLNKHVCGILGEITRQLSGGSTTQETTDGKV